MVHLLPGLTAVPGFRSKEERYYLSQVKATEEKNKCVCARVCLCTSVHLKMSTVTSGPVRTYMFPLCRLCFRTACSGNCTLCSRLTPDWWERLIGAGLRSHRTQQQFVARQDYRQCQPEVATRCFVIASSIKAYPATNLSQKS